MLWLINQATAGDISTGPITKAAGGDRKDEKKDSVLSTTAPGTSFSDFKIDASA
jgi:hypothetical protein